MANAEPPGAFGKTRPKKGCPWHLNLHLLNLFAFSLLVCAICLLAFFQKGDAAIMTGLIGVLGTFKPWSVTEPSNTPQPTRIVNDEDNPAITKEVE